MTSINSNNFVQEYLDANKALIRSMVVKSNHAVNAINQKLVAEFGDSAVDPYNPQSWKYYLNVAGKYHPTDKEMRVISLDTQQEILFSPEILRLQTATAKAYKPGSRFYYALIAKYPDQEFLINCILNPCDIGYAIDAGEGSILSYDSTLVEPTENTLIMELESFIKIFNARWDVQAFSLTDEFYSYCQRFILGQQLLIKLLNLRTKRRKTDEVHTFHLREYLASHHRLDRWLPYLTREQALWLYRNITFIERNAGHEFVFQALIENILDKRYIPLTDFTVRQLAEFTETMLPVVQVRRKQISLMPPATQKKLIGIDEYLDKELKTTYDNERWFTINKDRILHKTATSNSSVMQTKDLESFMQDLSTSVPDPLEEVLMRQLVAMTHMGLYNVMVRFQDPKSGIEYSLMTKDAIIYMLYLTMHMEKQPFEIVPPAINVKYRRHPRPDVSELKALIEPGMEWLNPIAEELVRSQPILTECYSVTMFYDLSYQVYLECQKHWKMLADCHDLYTRGVLEAMILKLFGWSGRDFSEGEDVDVWRIRNELPHYDYTYEEAGLLLKEIFTKSTGLVIDNTKTLKYIQKALLDLFMEISSYSIQVIRDINDGEVLNAGGGGVRVGNVREYFEDSASIKLNVAINSVENSIQDTVSLGDNIEVNIEAEVDVIIDSVILDTEGKNINIEINSDEKETIKVGTGVNLVTEYSVDPSTGNYIAADTSLDNINQAFLKKLSNLEFYK